MTPTRKPKVKRSYYVTVRDGRRTGFLLGPFKSHKAALAQVNRGRDLADEATQYRARLLPDPSARPPCRGTCRQKPSSANKARQAKQESRP